jgi:hypothetical protein
MGCIHCSALEGHLPSCPIRKPYDYTVSNQPAPGVVPAPNRSVQASEVKRILAERGARYGDFTGHAEIAQRLKDIVRAHSARLSPIHQEALDMIIHKIGRILNGDPNYADSWIDIAGYAQLVVDRLPGDK